MYKPLKSYLFLAALGVIAMFLVYTQFVLRALEKEAETTSRVYGKFCANVTDDETSIIFDEIVKEIPFPVIVTDPVGNVISARNVKSTSKDIIAKLDRQYKPVEIKYEDKALAVVHFGKSKLQTLLSLAPYATVGLGVMLVLIGLIWLYTIKRSEENSIFAGMSKETAHQLGTPISSLIGWKEFITDQNIKTAMTEDLEHISKVISRFHRIGSPITFTTQRLSDIIAEVTNYLKKRIPDKITIKIDDLNDTRADVDSELFSWAIENLIKNSVDAGSTEIKITTQNDLPTWAKITVEDNGKGILPKVAKKMFIPGYTTKEYGWGMGLALVRRIVNMHNGKLFYRTSLQSRSDGTGITLGQTNPPYIPAYRTGRRRTRQDRSGRQRKISTGSVFTILLPSFHISPGQFVGTKHRSVHRSGQNQQTG